MANILTLTADIVSAYVSHHTVTHRDVPNLVMSVRHALSDGHPPVAPTAPPVPVTPIARSVFQSYIICLDCGQELVMLKRHLRGDHRLSPEDYRRKWGLPETYPMTAPEYAKARSRIAKAQGLGRYKSVKRG